MSSGGKGSKPRPISVPRKQFDNNWERIFGKKKKDEQLLAELLLAAKDDFLKDVPISFHYFEDLCKQNNIKIPIATLGMARKKVINLSVSQAKTWGKVDLSKLFGYAKLLKDCLVPASTNDNDISEAESNHLFGVK